jgi:plastocyanin
MKTKLRFKTVLLSISVVILLETIGLMIIIMNIHSVYAQEEEVKEVQAGIGVGNAAIILFSPQQVQIKAGQSITWYNPTPVPEPHTVTFVLNNNNNNNNNNKSYAADLVAPFTISNTTRTTTNSTQIMPIIPNSNSEPLMTPDDNAIIAINKRAYNPVVVREDSTTTTGEKNVTYMKQNANYSMSGTEDYINSGWLLPKGQENVYPGSGNTFTMTFQKAGTYDYLCLVHPYMTGRVIVK